VALGLCVLVGAWLMSLCVFDVRQRRLPNFLTLPGAAVVVVAAFAAGRGGPAVAGAAALAGAYLLVHLVAPAAMGAGDVKLALGVGGLTGCFGVDVWALAAVGAPLATGLWALVELIRSGRSTVPHGPSMCVASAAAVALALL
jgi:leader peptidase (prepilin peptidase) / N-methyltransferase